MDPCVCVGGDPHLLLLRGIMQINKQNKNVCLLICFTKCQQVFKRCVSSAPLDTGGAIVGYGYKDSYDDSDDVDEEKEAKNKE